MEAAEVPGLGAPIQYATPNRSGSGAAGEELDDESQARQLREMRLLELEQELSNAQLANQALRDRLAEASFQQAVLARTSEAQKAFMAQTMVSQSDAERAREAQREEAAAAQRRADQLKLQQNERQMRDLQEAQRVLRASFDTERSKLFSGAHELERQLRERTEEQQRMAKETAALKARLKELEAEQQRTSAAQSEEQVKQLNRGTVQLYAPDGSALPPVSQDFFAFLAGSFKGDYLKLRHSSSVAHTLSTQAQMARANGLQSNLQEDVLFSDYVTKYNRRSAGQARVLVVTQTALYVFSDAKALELRRRIPIRQIDRVSLSRMCTDLLVVHHINEQGQHSQALATSDNKHDSQQAHCQVSAYADFFPFVSCCFGVFAFRPVVDVSEAR
jgi:hypothetical protein